MATATAQPAAAGVFTFLKHGVVLPARRCGPFLRVFALDVLLSTALYLFGRLAVAPLDAAVNPEDHNAAVSASSAADDAAKFSMSRAWLLLGAGTAYLALYQAAVLAMRVATACAAVAAWSGERHTFGSLLREVRGSLLVGSATIVLGRVLRAACTAAAVAALLALPLIIYLGWSPRLLLLDAVLAALAFLLCLYLDAVCAMAVVVAAAEPGRRRGGGAVARAWRLMRGTGKRALLYVAATWALEVAAGSARALAMRRLPRGTDRVVVFLVGAGLNYVLRFAVDVISMATITAYYFECRRNEEVEKEKAVHID